jgi:hypothetical protein
LRIFECICCCCCRSWTLNGVSTVLLPGQTAGKTAIYSVDAFNTPPAAAAWVSLVAAAAAAGGAAPAAAVASSSSGSGWQGLSAGARIGLSIGISVGFGVLITLACLGLVMWRKHNQQNAVDPWMMQNASPHLRAAMQQQRGWQRRRSSASRGSGGCFGLGFCDGREARTQNRLAAGDAKDVTAGADGVSGDIRIPMMPGAAGTVSGALGVAHSGGALVAVGSGRYPTVIAPLPNALNIDDSSDDDDDDDAVASSDVTSRRHHHHHHHHGHKLNGAVQEGLEGDAEGLGFKSGSEPYDLEKGSSAAGTVPAAAAGWQQQSGQQQDRGMPAAAPFDSYDSAGTGANGSYYPPMSGGLLQPYESGKTLGCYLVLFLGICQGPSVVKCLQCVAMRMI